MSDENDCYDYGDPKRSDYREPAVCVLCHQVGGVHRLDCPARSSHGHAVPALNMDYLRWQDLVEPPQKWWQTQRTRTVAQVIGWAIITFSALMICWLMIVAFATLWGASWAPTTEPVGSIQVPCSAQYPQCHQEANPWRVDR